jgi:SAM-dependent methyltransferase
MATTSATFDGLADDYDRARPRYPAEPFARALELIGSSAPITAIDAGAGTGIALEVLEPQLPDGSDVHAVDVSTDMVRIGQTKFPRVRWAIGQAEDFLEAFNLESSGAADLIVAAQSYQWMDRPRFLRAAGSALRPRGVCMIIQNNRDYRAGGFAAAYESLLEKYSPGYQRTYRAIDVATELSAHFPRVESIRQSWNQSLTVDAFVTMSSSSTQAQRAIQRIGPAFLAHVRELCEQYLKDGFIHLPYVTEAYFGINQI